MTCPTFSGQLFMVISCCELPWAAVSPARAAPSTGRATGRRGGGGNGSPDSGSAPGRPPGAHVGRQFGQLGLGAL